MTYGKFLLVLFCILLLAGCADKSPPGARSWESSDIEALREPPPQFPEAEPEASEAEPETFEANPETDSASESGESEDPSDENVTDSEQKDPNDITNTYGYSEVVNTLFNFRLTVPQTWYVIDSPASENLNSILLYDSEGVDIRAYGESAISGEEFIQDLTKDSGVASPFVFNSGDEGWQVLEDGMYILFTYHAYERNITFYVNFEKNPDWYEANQELVRNVARTLRDND